MQSSGDDLPIRKARTGNFRRGQPRSVTVFGDAKHWRVRYLASTGPTDPVLALHQLAADGDLTVLADPRSLLADREELPAAERARRERLREGGAGITAYHCDRAGDRIVFALSGQVWLIDGAAPVQLGVSSGAVDPRLSPDGSLVAYACRGALRLVDLGTGDDRILAGPELPEETWGLPEFIAAEEMGRYRGFWWSPGSDRLLAAQVDEHAVSRWWLSDPTQPSAEPREIRYPAAGTPNAEVRLWLVGLSGERTEVRWDRTELPYLAAVRWEESGAVVSVQSRDQSAVHHLRVNPGDGTTDLLAAQRNRPWVELVPGSPRLAPDGDLVLVDADPATDAWRLRKGEAWLTPPDWYIRSLHRCDASGIWVSGAQNPWDNHLVRLRDGELTRLTDGSGWHTALATGEVPVIAVTDLRGWQPRVTVGDPPQPEAELPNAAASPGGEPRVHLLPESGDVRTAVILPPQQSPAPVIVSSYGGPHAQRVVRYPLSFATEQWLADSGFAVVVVDGRGTPGVSPSCEAAVAGDLASGPLADQIAGLHAAQRAYPGRLDTGRVGIRGWSFGGYLAALAVLREPDVFRAAFAGAPVTEWRLYDTHYTERYLGDPTSHPEAYDRSSLLPLAARLRRPLCLVHGLADDNVVAAHTLQLSAALTAHGRQHQVLPLPGVSHMTPQESVTEQLLRMERAFFAQHLGAPADTR